MRRTRLKPISDKRRALLREYTKLRREFLDLNPICQVCGNKRSFDIHHKQGRFGRRLLDTTLWVAACRTCHRKIHDHPGEARDKGHLI
jgi:5-methylcytosine-specific restriction endonuclease McrA